MLRGWGRIGVPASERRSEDLVALTEGAVLSRGLGRSYGDSSLPPPSRPLAANTTLADRILAFDPEHAASCARKPGSRCSTLNRLFLPRGFFLPVSPGTQFVTLGGMVAADVHGKNHHVDGCFGAHVTSLRLRVADGRIVECGPGRTSPSCSAPPSGGMGLTGHILEVEFRLERIPTPWIWAETRAHARHRRLHGRPQGRRARVALHHGLDRLPDARGAARPRHPDARALGRAPRGAASPAAAAAPPGGALRPSPSPSSPR